MKDNFSQQSADYARYRPVYPDAYFEFILSITKERNTAWDCGAGNGQVAEKLSMYFDKIYATDISAQQIEQAVPNEKIEYSVQPAEQTNFPDGFFDLIVAAQAVHWFDFDRFYTEVNRTLKKDGIISVLGYNRPVIVPEVDEIITRFYQTIVGPYWDKERKYIDEHYQTIPFPFEEVESPKLQIVFEWSFKQLVGYLGTWSAVKHFTKEKEYNPVTEISNALKIAWGNEAEGKSVCFPVMMRTGRK